MHGKLFSYYVGAALFAAALYYTTHYSTEYKNLFGVSATS